jgi:LPXTG-motif cell wall-anchored protein
MLKKIISIALAALMVMSVAVVVASAADTDSASAGAEVSNSAGADTSNSSTGSSNVIYFDYGTTWKNVSQIYAHIWVIGGDSFYSWQAGGEKCDRVSGTKWSYDLSKLSQSTTISGGLKKGTDYAVIFSADNGLQTFDQTFGTPCIGDTAKLTGDQIENAVDSEKKAYESVWKTNSSKYGPHLAISSIGNIIGSKLAPNETGTQVIGDWLYAYYNSQTVDPVATLAKALPKFSVKDIDAVYAYIMSKDSTLDSGNLSVIQDQLQQAYKKAYGETKKVDTKKAKSLEQKIKSGTSLKSVSSDSGSSSGTSSSSSSSSSSTNSSGSGADGQETTIFFILGGVMIMAAAAMVISRKKREE